MWGDLYICDPVPVEGPHSIKMPAPLFYYHLRLDIAATCISVIRPVVRLWCKPSSAHCQWFNTVPGSFRSGRPSGQLCGPVLALFLKDCLLCFDVVNISILFPFANRVFQCFYRCFEWETPSQKNLIPFICVVFESVVRSWKNALALPVESSQSERFLPCQLEQCKICATENAHLFTAVSLLLFLFL